MFISMCCCCGFFFFKQKTAYEMRISDWSSDVCSSDLVDPVVVIAGEARGAAALGQHHLIAAMGADIVERLNSVIAAARHHDRRGSEEHTSELQSLMRISYAVFCLKKKNKTKTKTDHLKQLHKTQFSATVLTRLQY